MTVKIRNLGLGYKLRAGRSKTGVILVRGRSSAVKKLYRYVDFGYQLSYNMCFKVLCFLKDSFRGYLMLVMYFNGIFSYRLAIEGLRIGDNLNSDIDVNKINVGIVRRFIELKEGIFINQLNATAGYYGQLIRSSGVCGQLVKLDFANKIAMVRLSSSQRMLFDINLYCVTGVVANRFWRDELVGKAGINILRGRRPLVRGVAMNPVDHPNGGRTPGGKVYRSIYNNIARSAKKTCSRRSKFVLSVKKFETQKIIL